MPFECTGSGHESFFTEVSVCIMIFQMFGCLVVVKIGYNVDVVCFCGITFINYVKNSIRKHETLFESPPWP
jgi:hypothetical protein